MIAWVAAYDAEYSIGKAAPAAVLAAAELVMLREASEATGIDLVEILDYVVGSSFVAAHSGDWRDSTPFGLAAIPRSREAEQAAHVQEISDPDERTST